VGKFIGARINVGPTVDSVVCLSNCGSLPITLVFIGLVRNLRVVSEKMSILLRRASTTTTDNPAMATTLQGFRFTARSCKCQPAARQYATKSIDRRRPFSTTALRCQEQAKDDADPALRAALDKTGNGPNAEYGKYLESELSNFDKKLKRSDQTAMSQLKNRVHTPVFEWQKRQERIPKTFLNEGEDKAIDGFPEYDEEDDDDIPTLAHGELEHHREMRHYARLAAWEMPMLSSKHPTSESSSTYVGGCWILDEDADGE
jgi:hypothetical protein